jgi:hypothetical protein
VQAGGVHLNVRRELYADGISRRFISIGRGPFIQFVSIPDHSFGVKESSGQLQIVPWCSHGDGDGAVYAVTAWAKLDSDLKGLFGGYGFAHGQMTTILKAVYADGTTWKNESSFTCMVGLGLSWLAIIKVGHFRFDEFGSGPVIRLPW